MQRQIAERICRTCLTVEGPLLSIYDSKTYSSHSGRLADMISELSDISPEICDGLPETICLSCVSEINRCYAFKTKCKSSDLVLRKLLYIPTDVELQTKADTEIDLSDEEEKPQKRKLSISVDALFTEAKCEDAKSEIDLTHTESTKVEEIETCYVVLSSDEENEAIETKNITQETANSDEPLASKMPETVDKITKTNKYESTSKRKRKRNNENLKCILCQKDFHMNFQNLAKHLIERHNLFQQNPIVLTFKQKPQPTNQDEWESSEDRSDNSIIIPSTNSFQCKECPRTFKSEVELLSHVWIHTSGHGFVCEICKNAYTSRTHLAIHERIHTEK